jgi:hypothetical protein
MGATAPRDSLDYPVYCYARSRLALADGRAGEALAAAEEAGRILAADYDMDHPGLFPWRSVAAVAAHSLGHPAHARQVATRGPAQARSLGILRVTAHALRALARVESDEHRLGFLVEAAGLMEQSPSLLEQTAVLVDLGTAQHRCGEPRPALRTLRRAYAQAASMQAVALARPR